VEGVAVVVRGVAAVGEVTIAIEVEVVGGEEEK
jgi:hypothetical protein